MKKLFAALICATMLLSMLIPVCAEGGEDFVAEIGDISLPYGTPTIDGTITAGEGWSEAKPYDKTNVDGGWGGEPVTIAGNLYRAFDETNLYIAADIVIEEVALCEGVDWLDGNEYGNMPGWDGDTFILSLDPLCQLIEWGFVDDTTPWYCFGIFEGGVVRTYRTHYNDKEITDIAPAQGAVTADGWRFEAAIPWETICADIETCSYGDISITPEEILENGNRINASFIYYDRRHDPEAEERITYSRYVSIATTTADGMPGTLVTPWQIKAQGIHLNIEGIADDDVTTNDIGPADTLDTGSGVSPLPPSDTTNTTDNQPGSNIDTDNSADDITTGADPDSNGNTQLPADTTNTITDNQPGSNIDTDNSAGDVTTGADPDSNGANAPQTTAAQNQNGSSPSPSDTTLENGAVTNNAQNTEAQSNSAADNNANNNSSGSVGGASTTKPASTGAATGESSTQTFDIGIASAVGAIAVSFIGFAATKKRK